MAKTKLRNDATERVTPDEWGTWARLSKKVLALS